MALGIEGCILMITPARERSKSAENCRLSALVTPEKGTLHPSWQRLRGASMPG
jgi:hypothetical protein